MDTQPDRHDRNDQPWLGFSIAPHPSMAAQGFSRHLAAPDQATLPQPGHAEGVRLELQPRHALDSGALHAAEAAIQDATGRLMGVDADAAIRIGSWLIESACHEAQDWNAMQDLPRTRPGTALRSSPELRVAVDLPACLLRRDKLVTQTRHALARSGLLPCLLDIQLPEHTLADADSDLLLSLAALRDLGVGIGLDHFGTLAASPRALQRLPLTTVKLDPTLTRTLVQDRTSRITVKAAIALAHALNATVIAADVTNPTQRDILADLGCDTAQGPIFGGTLRPDAFHGSLLVPVLR
jgi:EAL domain-containing protein (putative c-di-GMP-specific phosphodiesterase class I)